MHRSTYRTLLVLGGFAAFDSTAHAESPQEPPKVTASMSCERAAEAGRVRCEASVRTDSGTLPWGELSVVALPPFATALRGRVGPSEATAHDATSFRWAFGLVAKRAGQGEARALVRVVACDAQSCSPVTVEVTATVNVGG